MTNTAQRLILFFAGIPIIGFIVFFIPAYGHIGVIALLTLVGIMCGIEMRMMLSKAAPILPLASIVVPALAPLLSWATNMGWIKPEMSLYVLLAAIIWALVNSVFSSKEDLSKGFVKIGSRLLLIMYPSFLLWWVARLTWYTDTRFILLVFMLTVFLNDSGAWFFGVLFGKHRGVFKVSPNKSIEGFLGGLFASVLVLWVSSRLLPDIFPRPDWQVILFGLLCGTAIIAGDLTESALKRSLGVKDSGTAILGRGGMLDSVDSVIFAAPAFVVYLGTAGLQC